MRSSATGGRHEHRFPHVLAWVPPYLLEGGGDGGWDLWALRDFETGTTQDYPPGTDLPRDTDPGLLAQWVAGHLGYPVTLTPGDAGDPAALVEPVARRALLLRPAGGGGTVSPLEGIVLTASAVQASQMWELRALGTWNLAAFSAGPTIMITVMLVMLWRVTGVSLPGVLFSAGTGCAVQWLVDRVRLSRRNRKERGDA